MTCKKEIDITVDWSAVVREVYRYKDKPMGVIAIRLQEVEPRLIKIGVVE